MDSRDKEYYQKEKVHTMLPEISNVKKELQEGRFVIISTSGVSMQPLLYDKKKKKATQVLVEPISGEIRKGDLILFEHGGKFIIHRLIKIKQDGNMITRGDNCLTCEHIKRENILGAVTQIYRKNRTIKDTDRLYRLYVRIWNMIFPFRYIYYRGRIVTSHARRRI